MAQMGKPYLAIRWSRSVLRHVSISRMRLSALSLRADLHIDKDRPAGRRGLNLLF